MLTTTALQPVSSGGGPVSCTGPPVNSGHEKPSRRFGYRFFSVFLGRRALLRYAGVAS
jgi:hypothetical protein